VAFGRGKNPVQEYPGLKGITGTFLVVFLFNSLPSLASCFDVLTHRHLPSFISINYFPFWKHRLLPLHFCVYFFCYGWGGDWTRIPE